MKLAKSIISVFLTLAIVFGTTALFAVSVAAADNSLGDTNSDGAINSFDALIIVRYCTGQEKLSDAELKAADVDGNGKINSTDALYILHFAVGKITSFPAGSTTDSGRVQIFGNFWYDPATGTVTNTDGSGLLGFSYDAKESVFYASSNAWQRTFGYTFIYDISAPAIVCWFDTSRIFFEYDGKEWMVQLWKGQYGWVLIGAEIGLYYRDFDNPLIDENGVKSLELLKSMYDNKSMDAGFDMAAADELQKFQNETCAMTFCWGTSNAKSYASEDYTQISVPFPSDDGVPSLEYLVNGFCVFDNKDEARAEAAKKLIAFICDDATYGPKSVLQSGAFPVRASYGNLYEGNEEMSLLSSWTKYYGPYYNTRLGFAGMRTEWWNMLQRVFQEGNVQAQVDIFNTNSNK